MGAQEFAFGSMPTSALVFVAGVGLVMAIMCTVFVYMVRGLKTMRIEIGADEVAIRAPFYGRKIKRSSLKLDEATRPSESELRERGLGRRNGVALPGYRVGWFSSRKTSETARMFVGNLGKVLRVPTGDGFVLYVSADDPDALLASLRSGKQAGATQTVRIPGGKAPYLFLGGVIVPLVVFASMMYAAVGPKRLVIDANTVEVKGPWYGTRIDRSQVVSSGVRVVDFAHDGALEPHGKAGGFDLFDYVEGHVHLRDGEAAFVLINRSSPTVYIPTTAGYAILFSTDDPQAVVAALK